MFSQGPASITRNAATSASRAARSAAALAAASAAAAACSTSGAFGSCRTCTPAHVIVKAQSSCHDGEQLQYQKHRRASAYARCFAVNVCRLTPAVAPAARAVSLAAAGTPAYERSAQRMQPAAPLLAAPARALLRHWRQTGLHRHTSSVCRGTNQLASGFHGF